jgi:hypothetical protein
MREIVHHVDGQSDRLRARRHRNADIAGTGAEDRDDAGEISRQRIAIDGLDPREVVRSQSCQFVIAVGRIPADLSAGRRQQPQFCARELTRSDEQHLAALQIQEDRQIAHPTLAFPKWGVD